MEVVINSCYGGFSLSEEVYKELGLKWDGFGYIDNEDLGIKSDNWKAYRADKQLIKAIKKVGLDKASGKHAELEIIEIPNDVEWTIEEYDGVESIHEKHRVWG